MKEFGREMLAKGGSCRWVKEFRKENREQNRKTRKKRRVRELHERKNALAHQQGRNPLAGANYTNYTKGREDYN
jgi:hypothetical protein